MTGASNPRPRQRPELGLDFGRVRSRSSGASAQRGRATFAIVGVSATLDPRIEQAAWLRLLQAGVRLTSWSAFAGEVTGNYLEEPGPRVRAIVGQRLGAAGGVFHARHGS